MPKVDVPSLRKKTRKSRTLASRAVVSQHTLVAMPLTTMVSMPRPRSTISRSVPWKAPKRGLSRRMSLSSTASPSCNAAECDPLSMMPSRTGGISSPITPILEPSGRTTWLQWTTAMPALRHTAASRLMRSCNSSPSGAETA